jgi:hypothetical protein
MPKMSLTEKKELACDALDSTRAVLVKLDLFKQIASGIESHMMNKARSTSLCQPGVSPEADRLLVNF